MKQLSDSDLSTICRCLSRVLDAAAFNPTDARSLNAARQLRRLMPKLNRINETKDG